MDDFRWGPWWLRCIEFHFGKGFYRVGDQFGWHMHKEVQIEIPLRGRFRFAIKNRRNVIVGPGQVLVIPPDCKHRWWTDAPGIMLGLSLALIPRAGSLDNSISRGLKPTAFSPPGIELTLQGLVDEFLVYSQKDDFAPKRRASWMFLVITQVLSSLSETTSFRPTGEPTGGLPFRSERIVSKIIRYIDANVDGDLTMERIESIAVLSARQIHRLFVEVTGKTCHAYIMNRRLEVAQSKLQTDPSLSIKEIAFASGFASAAHFSSKFKEKFGMPPSKYS